jgi:L-amino acid N-acyltransferase YncA
VTTEPTFTIRPMDSADWTAVRAIYVDGIGTGNATFETEAPEWENWDSSHLQDLRFVAVEGDVVVGWAAASPVSDRCCYSGVVEDSVYIDPAHHGKGVGKKILGALIEASELAGTWTIQTGIFPENTASVALHEASGFRIVGRPIGPTRRRLERCALTGAPKAIATAGEDDRQATMIVTFDSGVGKRERFSWAQRQGGTFSEGLVPEGD